MTSTHTPGSLDYKTEADSDKSVLAAMIELRALEQPVTRHSIAKLLGLELGVVDDRAGKLVNEGKAVRHQRGNYQAVEQYPEPRQISKTIMPDGMVIFDIGDDVIKLTPKEDRMLATMQAGVVLQTAVIETGHQSAMIAADLSLQLKNVRRELSALKRSHGHKTSAQMELMP